MGEGTATSYRNATTASSQPVRPTAKIGQPAANLTLKVAEKTPKRRQWNDFDDGSSSDVKECEAQRSKVVNGIGNCAAR